MGVTCVKFIEMSEIKKEMSCFSFRYASLSSAEPKRQSRKKSDTPTTETTAPTTERAVIGCLKR